MDLWSFTLDNLEAAGVIGGYVAISIIEYETNLSGNLSIDLFSDDIDNDSLIISNPPFHFEHETNIEVALDLFKEVKRCLKKGGSFQLVTSNHLNSKTHLHKLFHKVNIVVQNEKFVVYHCV